MSRRLWTLALVLALSAGCKKAGEKVPEAGQPLRLGFFPNLTHAQALVGNAEGVFAKSVGGQVELKQFNAGPAAMSAMLAGELDLTYVGPGPATVAFVRSKGALAVVAGAASGGAVFVTHGEKTAADLKGKRVASPQLGNTQDIALRIWLKQQGVRVDAAGGAVSITAMANGDILNLFKKGDLTGAWVPEPWGARLVHEAGGVIAVDERDLWPDGRFPTTVLVASRAVLEKRREDVKRLLGAHLALTRRAAGDKLAFGKAANEAFGKLTGKVLPEPVLADALSRLEFVSDPMEQQMLENAKHSAELGFLPAADLSGLVDRSLLAELGAAPAAH